MRIYLLTTICGLFFSAFSQENPKSLELDEQGASRLIQMPLTCLDTEYPNKLGQVLGSAEDLKSPADLHPAFYGCFDWHSSVHGHWSLARLIHLYPNMESAQSGLKALQTHITEEHIRAEIAFFEGEHNKSFERMYGWAWLLKLQMELNDSPKQEMQQLGVILQPLSDLVVSKIMDFLPKLNYPIRVGTHTNTAFAFSMILDYALSHGDDPLRLLLLQRSKDYFFTDESCPMTWEPSGADFLSPCLEEANLMRRVLSKEKFRAWLQNFMPELSDPNYQLEPGIVSDRSDGHLVHLDGLNFSRAWCLKGITNDLPEYTHLNAIANAHIAHSLPEVVGDSYEGGHWLASFALLALSGND